MEDEIIRKLDIILIILIAVGCGMFSEFLSWIFVYRHEKFLALNEELKVLYEKVQREKEEGYINKIYQKKGKKISAEETYIQKTKQMTSLKTKANLITGFIFMGMMPILFSLFEGLTIAILPFKPIFPISLITHTGIQGRGPYDCSSTFIYTLTLMLTRQNIQKFFGYAPPSGMFGDFQIPDEQETAWK